MSRKPDLDEFGLDGVGRDAATAPVVSRLRSESRASTSVNYFLPGDYCVEIRSCDEVSGPAGQHLFTVEAKCVTSNNTRIRPGKILHWVAQLDNLAGPRAVAGFIAAAFGTAATAHDLHLATASDALKGVRMDVEARAAKAKSGATFTRVVWSKP